MAIHFMTTAPQLLFIATLITNFMLCSPIQKTHVLFGSSVSNDAPYVNLSQIQLAGMTAGQDFNTLLAGLLDIGADANASDDSVSYVPPLDGRDPVDSASYFMTFVPFDIKLVSIKKVDPLGSSFTIQWKMILQWVDIVSSDNDGKKKSSQHCSFVCDTTNSDNMCCDNVWVPPLNIPQCNIDSIDSTVDDTLSVYWYFSSSIISSYTDCQNKPGNCHGRRFWKLNIQTTCDNQMNFENFPFDIQLLKMDILNPYSSRTWLQLVRGTLLNDGGDIVNGDPLPEQHIPSWNVKNVVVSVNCSVPTWLQTFSTQNRFLGEFQPAYASQDPIIQKALTSLQCAHNYSNLHVPENESIASPGHDNSSVYNIILNDYKERFKGTLETYRSCVEKTGKEYRLGPNPRVNDRPADTAKLFGNWLNVSSEKPSNISFECLIQATANLTTPIIRITIVIQRYRMFYVVKLVLPTIACGLFTFAVVAIGLQNVVGRLSVIVPAALALTALQIAVTATDIPAVAYLVPTSYIVIVTYGIQTLVICETIFMALWRIRKPKRSTLKSNSENPTEMELQPIAHDSDGNTQGCTQNTEINRDDEVNSSCLRLLLSHRNEGWQLPPNVPGDECIAKRDIGLLLGLAFLYLLAIGACLLVPYLRAQRTSIPQGTSIWKSL